MKKVLSLVALLGALGGAASAAPYYLPSPAGGELTPYDWQPAYSIEGLYNFAAEDDEADTYGARLVFSLYSNAVSTVRHEFSLSAGYEGGTEKNQDIRVESTRIPLMLGYDANVGLTDHVFLDLGAKAGYAWRLAEFEDKTVEPSGDDLDTSDKVHTGGFTFALDAGIKVQCSDTLYVKVGYEFSRSFYNRKEHVALGQHSIVVGFGARW